MHFSMSNESDEVEEEPVIPPSDVQFWTFLTFQIPSLACTIFLIYQLLWRRKSRRAMHNHVILILLILVLGIEIFDNPLYIDAYRFGGHANSFPMTVSICLMWWMFDYGFYGAITVFLAWGSIERHLLVFHHHLLRSRRQKWFFHYLPLLVISIYLIGFYVGVLIYPPCETTFDFEALACGLSPCYEEVSHLNIWDYLVNGIICTCVETIASVTLLIRVFAHRRRAHQSMNWKKHRKMAFQLLSISFLSLTIVFPQSFIIVVQKVGGPEFTDFGAALDPYLFYFYTYVVFLLPFICLVGSPELWPKRLLSRYKGRGSVMPVVPLGPNLYTVTLR